MFYLVINPEAVSILPNPLTCGRGTNFGISEAWLPWKDCMYFLYHLYCHHQCVHPTGKNFHVLKSLANAEFLFKEQKSLLKPDETDPILQKS